MEFVVLGWPPEGPTLRLDYRRFSYAGKFVMSNTGKAVVRAPSGNDGPADGTGDGDESVAREGDGEWADDVFAAAAFNEDRTDPAVLWLRYVTVRADRRGDGLGPRLAAFVASRAAERGYERVRIAVNNPFAYEALYKAGFAYVGRRTGLAELVLERPAARPVERDAAAYREGLAAFRERDWDGDEPEVSFLAAREGATPPALTAPPDPSDTGGANAGG